MAETDIILGVDFDTKDAISDAKNLKREVDDILSKDSGTKNSAIADMDNRLKASTQSADKLVKKLHEISAKKIPTQSYTDLSNTLRDAEKEFDKVLDESEKLAGIGKRWEGNVRHVEHLKAVLAETEKVLQSKTWQGRTLFPDEELQLTEKVQHLRSEIEKTEKVIQATSKQGQRWQELKDKSEELSQEIHHTNEEMQKLVDTGKAFTFGKDTDEYKQTEQKLEQINDKLKAQLIRHRQINEKVAQTPPITERIKKSVVGIGVVVNKLNSKINTVIGKWRQATKQVLAHRKALDGAGVSLTGLIKKLLMYGLGIQGLFSLIGKLRSTLKEGFQDVYDSGQLTSLNNKIDSLKGSLLTLKYALVGAFAPIVETVIPYIQKLIEWLTKAIGVIAQFFAALTGRSTYLRAIKQSGKKAVQEEKEEIEDETEAIEEQQKQLSGLDKLNVLHSEKKQEDKKKKPKKGKDEGTDIAGPIFEEVPIDSKIKAFAEKIKKMLADLLYPIKEAWKRTKDFVLSSWKKAIESMKKLAKTVWDDFIEVWKQEATIKIFEDIFKIIGNIGLLISELADRIREAWEYNGNGKAILEAIRDIIGIIIRYIRMAVEATVEWAKELDLRPLFGAIRKWLESLKRPVEFIMGVLYDLYTHVVLPFTKYLLETGIPALLKVFTTFNETVDWEGLRNKLIKLWDALEPFLQKAWEGFVIFVQRIATAVADFINSEKFEKFLDKVKDWMDSVSAEDFANTFELLAKGIIAIKLAALGFNILGPVVSMLTSLSKLGPGLIGTSTGLGDIVKVFATGGMKDIGASMAAGGTAAGVTFITSFIAAVASAIAGWHIGQLIDEKLNGEKIGMSFTEQMSEIRNAFADGTWKDALDLWWQDIKWAWGEIATDLGEDINNLFEDWHTSFSTGITNIKTSFITNWTNMWNDITGKSKEGKETVSQNMKGMKDDVTTTSQETKNTVSMNWANMVSDIVTKVTEIKTSIQTKFAEIKANLQGKLAEIRQSWSNVWTSLVNKVTSAVSAIRSKIASMASWVSSKISAMKSGLESLKEKASNLPVVGGMFRSSSTYKAPGAATGAVIPPQMSQRIFTVGDNNSETEVISPLSTMQKAMVNALQEAGLTNNGGGGDIVINIDGREVFRVVQTQANQYSNQHGGRSAFAGA